MSGDFDYLETRHGLISVPKSKPTMKIKDPNCPICYPKVMGLSPEGWIGVRERHDQGHQLSCCPECICKHNIKDYEPTHCASGNCPCHKSAEKPKLSAKEIEDVLGFDAPATNTGEALENRHIKIAAGAKDFAERFEPVMKELAGEAPTDESWKKSFDVIFGKNIIIPRRTIEDEDVFLATKLKVFISELLQEEREKGRRKGDATGDLRGYMEGLENGKQLGKSEAYTTVRKVIEGKKLLEVAVSPDRLLYKRRWNAALSDLLATLGE